MPWRSERNVGVELDCSITTAVAERERVEVGRVSKTTSGGETVFKRNALKLRLPHGDISARRIGRISPWRRRHPEQRPLRFTLANCTVQRIVTHRESANPVPASYARKSFTDLLTCVHLLFFPHLRRLFYLPLVSSANSNQSPQPDGESPLGNL